MLNGYVHPDFAAVGKTLQKQLPKGFGGAAVCVYHKGEKVVDIWGGTKNTQGDPWIEDTISLSFSTTKGVASSLLHVVAEKGLIDYEEPVAKYWPEFAVNGKEDITVRQALSHSAGLYLVEDHLDDGHDLCDWHKTKAGMAAAKPDHTPGNAHGYHGLNYGHLVGGIVEGATGKPFKQVLREELVEPLKLDGCFIGLPEDQMHRRAELVTNNGVYYRSKKGMKPKGGVSLAAKVLGIDFTKLQKTLMPGSTDKFNWNEDRIVQAVIPAASGMFTARSLAKIYGMIANGGEIDGVKLLSPERIRQMGSVQNRTRDKIIGMPMHWRLGYHRVFAVGAKAPRGFGHFGFGGSGACCDPERNIAIAMTLNSGVGTPMGDTRTPFIIGAALKAADKREREAVKKAKQRTKSRKTQAA